MIITLAAGLAVVFVWTTLVTGLGLAQFDKGQGGNTNRAWVPVRRWDIMTAGASGQYGTIAKEIRLWSAITGLLGFAAAVTAYFLEGPDATGLIAAAAYSFTGAFVLLNVVARILLLLQGAVVVRAAYASKAWLIVLFFLPVVWLWHFASQKADAGSAAAQAAFAPPAQFGGFRPGPVGPAGSMGHPMSPPPVTGQVPQQPQPQQPHPQQPAQPWRAPAPQSGPPPQPQAGPNPANNPYLGTPMVQQPMSGTPVGAAQPMGGPEALPPGNPQPPAHQFPPPPAPTSPSAGLTPAGIPAVWAPLSMASPPAPLLQGETEQYTENTTNPPSAPSADLEDGSTRNFVDSWLPPAQETAPASSSQPEVPEAEDEADQTVLSADVVLDESTVLSPRVPQAMPFVLTVVGGDEYELPASGEVEIGRDSRRNGAVPGFLSIKDPTRTLSKSHARLRRDGDRWFVTDLNSTNGTSLRDVAGVVVDLVPGQEREVVGIIQLGDLDAEIRPGNEWQAR